MVYVGSCDNKLYALDAATGNKLWEFATGSSIESCPAIGAGRIVYVASNDGKLYALNGRKGKKVWEFVFDADDQLPRDIAIDADGAVYVTSERALYMLNGQTGEKLWEFDARYWRGHGYPIIAADGTLYCAFGPKLFALYSDGGGPVNLPWPMFGQNAQRTGCAAKPSFAPASSPPHLADHSQKIARLLAEAKTAEAAENSKWFRKRDFTRARYLYAQAAALGSEEAAAALKRLGA